MRCPPVTLIIGMSNLSAVSAMRRSSSAVVTPPDIRGTTEKVPSRWMLACTRSLMYRASRSSTNSPAQITLSSDARAILDAASSPSGANSANTSDTDLSWFDRMASTSAGFSIGIAGTYQFALSSTETAPPPSSTAHSTIWATTDLHDPQPLPARVFAITPATLSSPSATHPVSAPLETPLQLQTCAESSISSAPLASLGPARENSSSTRSSGSGNPRSKLWVRNATFSTSPSSVAPTSLPPRTTTDL